MSYWSLILQFCRMFSILSVLTLKNKLAKVGRFAVEQDQDISTEISAQTVELNLLTVLNRNNFILWDFWVHYSVLWPRRDAVRRKRENYTFFFSFFFFTRLKQWFFFLPHIWGKVGSHSPVNPRGKVFSRGTRSRWWVPIQASSLLGLAEPSASGHTLGGDELPQW